MGGRTLMKTFLYLDFQVAKCTMLHITEFVCCAAYGRWQPSIIHIILPLQWSWKGVYWFYLVRLFVRPSVRLWTKSCPLCISNNTHRILVIFTHLIKQLHVCSLYFFKIQNLNFWQIIWFCNFDFVLFWLRIQYESIVWVIMGRWLGILKT